MKTICHEAMIIIDNATGDMAIHPKTVAFGDSEKGQLMVPGWPGRMHYTRGLGTISASEQYDWDSYCLGDKICEAIAEGRIPLYSPDDLPENLKPDET